MVKNLSVVGLQSLQQSQENFQLRQCQNLGDKKFISKSLTLMPDKLFGDDLELRKFGRVNRIRR